MICDDMHDPALWAHACRRIVYYCYYSRLFDLVWLIAVKKVLVEHEVRAEMRAVAISEPQG